jgi:hypothetical protein
MSSTCPTCGAERSQAAPPEPPIGTWVKDRHGAVSLRHTVGDVTGWAPRGAMPYARWEAMWEARGPLTVCGPWGADL